MQIALNGNVERISALEAEKENTYRCPLCGAEVILKRGEINIEHFAHKSNACSDDWHYDMSEWHRDMQNRFPEECREVVVKHNGEKHRADILLGNRIIEFQNSPISREEITRRNDFYNAAGFDVAWVFNLQDIYEAGNIEFIEDEYKDNYYAWKSPKRAIQCFPFPKENVVNRAVYLYWVDDYGYECFNKIIWSSGDYEPDFKRIILSAFSPVIEPQNDKESDEEYLQRISLDVKDFFITKKDLLHEHLSSLHTAFEKKYSGVKGYSRNSYICPRTGVFGIPKYGERACRYCKHCGAIEKIKGGFVSYCCYPVQVNEADEPLFGYECSRVQEF